MPVRSRVSPCISWPIYIQVTSGETSTSEHYVLYWCTVSGKVHMKAYILDPWPPFFNITQLTVKAVWIVDIHRNYTYADKSWGVSRSGNKEKKVAIMIANFRSSLAPNPVSSEVLVYVVDTGLAFSLLKFSPWLLSKMAMAKKEAEWNGYKVNVDQI